jgi:hypothetical protein
MSRWALRSGTAKWVPFVWWPLMILLTVGTVLGLVISLITRSWTMFGSALVTGLVVFLAIRPEWRHWREVTPVRTN